MMCFQDVVLERKFDLIEQIVVEFTCGVRIFRRYRWRAYVIMQADNCFQLFQLDDMGYNDVASLIQFVGLAREADRVQFVAGVQKRYRVI